MIRHIVIAKTAELAFATAHEEAVTRVTVCGTVLGEPVGEPVARYNVGESIGLLELASNW